MESKRKQCKECPWKNKDKHSLKFRGYVEKMNSIGKIENNKHACHMITNDVWGLKSEINRLKNNYEKNITTSTDFWNFILCKN